MKNSYFDTPLYQQQAGIYFLKKLFKENPSVKFFIFSIPLTSDVNSIKENDKRNVTHWFSSLKNLDKENDNIIFLDLADFVPNNYQNYFFPDTCDGHWNKDGHKWAGKVLSDRIIEIFR